MDNIEKARLLFNALKRDKDKTWHKRDKDNVCSCGIHPNAKYAGIYCYRDRDNPNFFDPKDQAWELFGWLIERISKSDKWQQHEGFLSWMAEREEAGEEFGWAYWNGGDFSVMDDLIDCTALATALFKYLELDNGK